MPLTKADLQAWLWRIDLTINLVAERAAQLPTEQLDWLPPDGRWSLRTMLHHLATGEGFYVIWVGLVLPKDPIERYVESSRQFRERLQRAFDTPNTPDTAFFAAAFMAEETYLTVEHIAQSAIQLTQDTVG